MASPHTVNVWSTRPVWTNPTTVAWRVTIRGKEKETDNIGTDGVSRTNAEARSGRRAGLPRRLYFKWSSSFSGAPSGQTMIYYTHLQNLFVNHPPLDCVCCLGSNCKLAIPVLVKGPWSVQGKGQRIGVVDGIQANSFCICEALAPIMRLLFGACPVL